MERVIEITTPLGKGVLLFHSLSAREELGRLFEFRIDVLSERSDIDPDKLLGRNVTVSLQLLDGAIRHFDACVTRFACVGIDGPHLRYRITGRPWLWFLTRSADCRIFQNKSVPDILKEVFSRYGCAVFALDRLTGSYLPREYCVQYRETDFNFVSRLMEEEGIHYWFAHGEGRHTLVLADSPGAHDSFPGHEEIPFVPEDTALWAEQECISEWGFSWEVQPGAYALDDFDFEKPGVELLQQTQHARPWAESAHAIYDYPGEYRNKGDGENSVRIRLEELQAQVQLIEGGGNTRGIAVGHVFRLSGHRRDDQNRKYLISASHIEAVANAYSSASGKGASFHCRFNCIASDLPFRTPRNTPKPVVHGLQTAIVVGPAGEEIHTDKYGRVKVHFHWDRQGRSDENDSCWIRVAYPWAGKNFGMMSTPRIGHEVLVEFLEGDPDRPLITGSVYNAEQMPPWELPGRKTQSGIRSHSTREGAPANFNEIRFEDEKGKEEVYVHAEKDMNVVVENCATLKVGFDKKDPGSQTVDIYRDRTTTLAEGNDHLQIRKGNQSIRIDAGSSTTEAMQAIELKVGQSCIRIDPQGVTIKGLVVKIEGTLTADLKSAMTSIDGSGVVKVKGGIVTIN